MKPDIRIEIRHNDTLVNILVFLAVVFLFIFIAVIANDPEPSYVLFTVLLGLVLGIYVYIDYRIPTTVWSDGETLYWKHLGKTHALRISDIRSIHCEPYETRTRYGTYQHLRLTLAVSDESVGEIELNDYVSASDLLDEKLGGAAANIPLLQLYQYLREHGCRVRN